MWQSINPSFHHFFNQDHLYTSFPLYIYIYINCLPLILTLQSLCFKNLSVCMYFQDFHSQVSNRRGVWNSRSGWKKYQEKQSGWLEQQWGRGGGWKKLKILIAGAGGVKLNFFFLSFFNHENYSIKNICVCSKSKLKTKETNKQNLAYFKIINRILFFHRFCKNSKMLLPPSWAMFMERPATNLGGFARGERTP